MERAFDKADEKYRIGKKTLNYTLHRKVPGLIIEKEGIKEILPS